MVNPPLVRGTEVQPPVALCSLASAVPASSEVAICDLSLELHECGVNSEARAFALFDAHVEQFEPDLIAVTSMYNNSLIADRLVRRTKAARPAVTTLAGGSHFGALGAEALKGNPALDFVLEGEGEIAFAALLEALTEGRDLSTAPNLVYRDSGRVRRNAHADLANLDEFPNLWVACEPLVSIERYAATIPASSARRVAYVEAGRGCPFSCTFCAPAQFWKRRYRVKPAAVVVDEIAYLQARFGYNYFQIIHDLLFADCGYVSDFCDALLARSLRIEWMANSRMDLRFEHLTEKLVASGCVKLFFGIESGTQRMQRQIKKDLDLEVVPEKVSRLSRAGIASTCSFVIGLPGETSAEISRTLGYGLGLRLKGADTVQYHRLRLFPPAPLAAETPISEFDRVTFALEYPFWDYEDEDLDEVRSRPDFYGGYFPPRSAHVEAAVLTRAEQFFQKASALAPITTAFIADVLGDELLDRFADTAVELIEAAHAVPMEGESRIAAAWRPIEAAVETLLDMALQRQPKLQAYRGLFSVEAAKVHLQAERELKLPAEAEDALTRIVTIRFDLAETIRRLSDGVPLQVADGQPRAVLIRSETIERVAVHVVD